jgi:iron complex transport system substrate-binding protein
MELRMEGYREVLEACRRLGARLDRQEQSERLVARIESRMESVRSSTADLERRTVLVVAGWDPLFVAGPGSYMDELVRSVGGSNVMADAHAPYQMVSLETVLERRPEVIVNASDTSPDGRAGRHAGRWARWDFLPAVRDERVWYVHPQRLSIPGPRIAATAELLRSLVHPERFGEPAPVSLGPLTDDEAGAGSAGEGVRDGG